MSQFADIIGAITMVALVTTIVAHPGTAKVVTAAGAAYTNGLRAAMGN